MPSPETHTETRRRFGARMLKSVIAYGMVEALWCQGLLADGHAAEVGKWFKELAELSGDLKGRKLTDLQFQGRMEELYRRVDSPS